MGVNASTLQQVGGMSDISTREDKCKHPSRGASDTRISTQDSRVSDGSYLNMNPATGSGSTNVFHGDPDRTLCTTSGDINSANAISTVNHIDKDMRFTTRTHALNPTPLDIIHEPNDYPDKVSLIGVEKDDGKISSPKSSFDDSCSTGRHVLDKYQTVQTDNVLDMKSSPKWKCVSSQLCLQVDTKGHTTEEDNVPHHILSSVKHKIEKTKRKRGRPPRKMHDRESGGRDVIRQIAALHHEPQFEPPDALMHNTSNVSPDSGIQSIAGSPLNHESHSPGHAHPVMPVPTPQPPSDVDIPELDSPMLSLEPCEENLGGGSGGGGGGVAPQLSPQPSRTPDYVPSDMKHRGGSSLERRLKQEGNSREDLFDTNSDSSCSKVMRPQEQCCSLLEKSEKRGRPRTKSQNQPCVVSETVSQKTTVDTSTQNEVDRRAYKSHPFGNSEGVKNKVDSIVEGVPNPVPIRRRGRPPKQREENHAASKLSNNSLFPAGPSRNPFIEKFGAFQGMSLPVQWSNVERESNPNQSFGKVTSPFVKSIPAFQTSGTFRSHSQMNASSLGRSEITVTNTATAPVDCEIDGGPKKKRGPGRPRKRPQLGKESGNPLGTNTKSSDKVNVSSPSFSTAGNSKFQSHMHQVPVASRDYTYPYKRKSLLAPSLLSARMNTGNSKPNVFSDFGCDTKFLGPSLTSPTGVKNSKKAGVELGNPFDSTKKLIGISPHFNYGMKDFCRSSFTGFNGHCETDMNVASSPNGEHFIECTAAKIERTEILRPEAEPKKVVPKIRKPKLHVMMRRPKKRGRKKKKNMEEISDLTKIVPAVTQSKKFVGSPSGLVYPCNEKPPKLQASNVSVQPEKLNDHGHHSDTSLASDSSDVDLEKDHHDSSATSSLTMPVLSPVRKDFFPTFPSRNKPVLKAEDVSYRKKKKKSKHFKSKHKNIVDPVFLADLDMATQDIAALLISEDGPAVPNFMKEEIPLPTIFQLNRQMMRRKRGKDRNICGGNKMHRLEARKEMEMMNLSKDKAKRGRKKKLISDSSLAVKDEDDIAAVNNEQCLPLKKRHKLISAATAANIDSASQEMAKQSTPRFLKLGSDVLQKPPEKRKVGRPRKNPLPEEYTAKPGNYAFLYIHNLW